MKNYGVIVGPKFLTVVADKAYSITTADARYAKAVEFVKAKDWSNFFLLLDKPAAIARYTKGLVSVYNDEVHYNGKPVHGVIVERILQFVNEGFSFEPLVAFLNNLYLNTDENVREKLYLFLENNQLAITDDGGFLAFKLVREDGSPIYHSGTFYDGLGNLVSQYEVGKVFTFPRECIVKTTGECSTEGLYVGNRQYWNNQFNADNDYTGEGRMLIVKVMPQDVCNIPHADATKIVVCKLDVIDEYKTVKEKANKTVYSDKQSFEKKHEIVGFEDFDFDDSDVGDDLVSTSRKPARDAKGRFISRPVFVRNSRGRFAKKSNVVLTGNVKRDAKGRFTS
jgi:hypothetical protein